MADRSTAYCQYYKSQLGGEIPIFRGGQHGAGIGDILRSILRFFAPVALRGISTFATNTMQAHERGSSLKDAARGALRPTISAMLSAGAQRMPQTGAGHSSALFKGLNGIPFEIDQDEYKRVSRKRKKPATTTKKAKKGVKRLREIEQTYNF